MKINRNLILFAAVKIKNMRLHKWMWSIMGYKYETHLKFKRLMMKTDENGYTVLQLAVMHNKLEIVQWIWKKLDKEVFNTRELRISLTKTTLDGKNILQIAAEHCKNPKIHEWIWETTVNKFDKNVLIRMIEHVDKHERNFYHLAALYNSNEIFVKLYELGKKHIGTADMKKLLKKNELMYNENVFDIAKKYAKDPTINTWLKTKKPKFM